MIGHRALGDDLIWPTVSLVILGSILVQGITATPFTEQYGRLNGSSGG